MKIRTKIQRIHNKKEHSLLKCPLCAERMVPLVLDEFEEHGIRYEHIWWTCNGLSTEKCTYPLDMDPSVFWTRRTLDQKRKNVIPLPNIELLAPELRYLYPDHFINATVPSPATPAPPGSRTSPAQRADSLVYVVPPSSPVPTASTPTATVINRKSRRRNKRKGSITGHSTVPSVQYQKPESNYIHRLDPSEKKQCTGGANFDAASADWSFENPPKALGTALAMRFGTTDQLLKKKGIIPTTPTKSHLITFSSTSDRKSRNRLSVHAHHRRVINDDGSSDRVTATSSSVTPTPGTISRSSTMGSSPVHCFTDQGNSNDTDTVVENVTDEVENAIQKNMKVLQAKMAQRLKKKRKRKTKDISVPQSVLEEPTYDSPAYYNDVDPEDDKYDELLFGGDDMFTSVDTYAMGF